MTERAAEQDWMAMLNQRAVRRAPHQEESLVAETMEGRSVVQVQVQVQVQSQAPNHRRAAFPAELRHPSAREPQQQPHPLG